MKRIFIFIALLTISNVIISQEIKNTEVESYFKNNKEIIFKFNVKSKDELKTLTKIISIDNVKGNEVKAYANQTEFSKFLALGYPYTIIKKESKGTDTYTMATTVAQMATWDKYPTYSVYEQMMLQFQTNYPNICNLDTILAATPNGHKILVLKISDNVNSTENEPHFLYTSSIHGDETTGYILMLRLINYLLSNYGTLSKVTTLVNGAEIWICPLSNPDGTYNSGDNIINGTSSTRNNANNVDMNRNYPDIVDGLHPDGNSWQPETQAFMTFADNHYLNMSANFHGGAEVVNYPWDSWTKGTPDFHPHPDDAWWMRVSKNYVDSARITNSSYLTDTYASGICEGGDWYVITGGRQDYMNYYKQCREITIELDGDKTTQTQLLNGMWTLNYKSLLNYLQESLYGIRGLVTDSCSGLPIKAKVYVNSHEVNSDSSFVYSNPVVGNYHRYLINGTYSITYSAPGYNSKTINNIVLANGIATTVNVVLAPKKPAINYAASSVNSCDGNINFTNLTTGATSWLWNFGDGTTSVLQNPSHSYTSAGVYTVKLKATNCKGSDSLTKTNYITVVIPAAPAVISGYHCGTGTVSLSASGIGTLNWYDALSGGNLVNTGTAYTTPSLTASTTYYVQTNVPLPAISSGKIDNTGGGGTNTGATNYLIFDAYKPFKLVSVYVYPSSTGIRIIQLRNSAGTVLQTATINITSTAAQTITLNFDVPVGTNLQLGLQTGSTVNLYRNNAGVVYPFSTSGLLSITGSSAGAAYYYFFYNWQVQEYCSSQPRTPVSASILSNPVADFSSSILGYQASFTNTSTGGNSYSWDFGDGGTSTNPNPTHTYSADGTYIVQLSVTNSCGTNVITHSVTILVTSLLEFNLEYLTLFPNPSSGIIQMSTSSVINQNASVEVFDIVGKLQFSTEVFLAKGLNNEKLDLSLLKSGLYFVRLNINDKSTNIKIEITK